MQNWKYSSHFGVQFEIENLWNIARKADIMNYSRRRSLRWKLIDYSIIEIDFFNLIRDEKIIVFIRDWKVLYYSVKNIESKNFHETHTMGSI